jgi:hypothetical protein
MEIPSLLHTERNGRRVSRRDISEYLALNLGIGVAADIDRGAAPMLSVQNR